MLSEEDSRAENPASSTATTVVDLKDSPGLLEVDISDALSERDWVKYTVHTRTDLCEFFSSGNEFSVVRLHEEFLWLHDAFRENPDYAGYIIPPPPPGPNFEASKDKLRKLGDAESDLTKEEFDKMKQELEAEYLACFKKTVAMHEAFLLRLTSHSVFRKDRNLHIFLEYGGDLNVRAKNKKEVVRGFLNSVQKSGDELLLSNTMKDTDEFFNKEKAFLLEYHHALRESTSRSDKMCSSHRLLAYNCNKLSEAVKQIGYAESPGLNSFLLKLSDTLEKMYRVEARVASDEDLKLSDTLRYHMRDNTAAKDLLYRRLRSLSNYETANKNLDKARARNKDLEAAENEQQACFESFNNISAHAREELGVLKNRRIASFQKSLVELAELELKHAKSHAQMLKATIATLKADL